MPHDPTFFKKSPEELMQEAEEMIVAHTSNVVSQQLNTPPTPTPAAQNNDTSEFSKPRTHGL